MQHRLRHSGNLTGTLGSRGGTSWQTYWNPLIPLGGETPNLWITSRSGLSMIDTIGGNNPTITLPYVWQSNNPLLVSDNGGLDIYTTDFTYAQWALHNSTVKTSYPTIAGKGISDGSPNGCYYWYQNITNGFITLQVQTSTQTKTISTGIDFTAVGWCFLVFTVDQTAKVIHVYVNGVEIGTGTSFTGTFAHMGNQYKFILGKSQNTAASGYAFNINCFFGEGWLLNRLLTPTEMTTLYGRGHLVDTTSLKAHWPLNDLNGNDVTGNGFTLLPLSGETVNSLIYYDTVGSRHLLDIGYSRYVYSGTSIKRDIYVGYSDAGTPMVTPYVPAGYTKASDHSGSLTAHNLADSYLTFVGANWSRDNATIFGDVARIATGTGKIKNYYLVATPKAWHISELNRVKMNTFFNSAYKGIAFPKVTNNSVDDRQLLTEIFGYASNKTGTDYTKALTYTGDHGHSWDISYYFSDTHYVATHANKILAYDGNTTFSLSLDGGSTFPITKNVAGYSGNVCEGGYIGDGGEIYFISKTKVYYSFDNLTTVTEATVLDIAGDPHVPGTYNNYCMEQPSKRQYIGATEVLVWGNYSVEATSDNENANIWQLVIGETTVRSIYNYKAPSLLAIHTESLTQNPTTEKFYATTGDGAGKCHIIEMTCNNLGTNDWTFTEINPLDNGEGFFHWVGCYFHGGYIYAGVEEASYVATGNSGTWRALATADLSDDANYTMMVHLIQDISLNLFGEDTFMMHNECNSRYLYLTNNLTDYYIFKTIGGADPNAAYGGYFAWQPKNTAGYYLGQIFAVGESTAQNMAGQVIMLKIVEE